MSTPQPTTQRSKPGTLIWVIVTVAALALGGAITVGSVATARAVEQGVFPLTSGNASTPIDSGEDAGESSTTDTSTGSATPGPSTPVIIILDASGSMVRETPDGRTRMEVAREAVSTTISQLPDSSEVGLLVFGTGTGNSDAEQQAGCQDIVTLADLGPLDQAAMQDAVSGVEASGFTPLGPSLTHAAGMFGEGQPGNIVLISDGVDTCSPPPACEVASQLHADNSELAIHVVGFSVDDDEQVQQQLQCIGESGGGTFVRAENVDQLTHQLNSALDPELADKSLSEQGFKNVSFGMRLDEVLGLVPDAEVISEESKDGVVYVYVDCGWGQVELQDDSVTQIIPVDSTATRDGLAPGDSITQAETLYGPAVDSGQDDLGTFEIYAPQPNSRTGYRIYAESGTITIITVCSCVPITESATELATWDIGFNHIGPIRLGDSMDQVQQAVPWFQPPVEGENLYSWPALYGSNGGYTWTHYEGTNSYGERQELLSINLNQDYVVTAVTVGAIRTSSADNVLDGSVLPSARGIRIGDTGLTARNAYPGGTVFTLSAGGMWSYSVSDREGHVMDFTLSPSTGGVFNGDRADFDGASIAGIRIEDATARASWYDGIPYILEEQGYSTDSSPQPTPEAQGNPDTGTLTALQKLDPWNDDSAIIEPEMGEDLFGCGRDGYRSDRVDCALSSKCILDPTESQGLCVGITGTELSWTLTDRYPGLGPVDSADDEADQPTPLVLELADGRKCFFGSGAGPEPVDGFQTWSGGCRHSDVGEVEILWSSPTSESADFGGWLFLEPSDSGYLRVGVGGAVGEAPATLVDVVTIYW